MLTQISSRSGYSESLAGAVHGFLARGASNALIVRFSVHSDLNDIGT